MLNISTTKQAKIKGRQESCRGDVYACYLEYGDVFTGIYIYSKVTKMYAKKISIIFLFWYGNYTSINYKNMKKLYKSSDFQKCLVS